MPGPHGVAQLLRLREQVRGVVARRLVTAALERAAARAGLTTDDLSELAAPTFGLEAGALRRRLGDWTVDLTATGVGRVTLCWRPDAGPARPTAPSVLRYAFPDDVKALTATAADLRAALSAQRDRLERLLMAERVWSFVAWRARYLDHPLLSILTRQLIWRFGEGPNSQPGAWWEGRLVDAADHTIEDLDDATSVRLWRPVDAEVAEVLAWRRWLESHAITQPFKQAHREVYLLTEAERQTAVYSNRFAAHLLLQHQLRALCQERGWIYRLQGPGFDGTNSPTLALPAFGLTAEFDVDVLEEGAQTMTMGIARYVTTGRLRFRHAERRATVTLESVPPAVFSDVLRDVDLFVAICSVANDPTWVDGGLDTYRDYWRGVAFGDLGETARTRRAQLARLLPHLKIAARAELTDRFLVVRGDLHTYRIHLGSGNILMEPGSRYLCIVPRRRAAGAERVYVPYEGDATLAVILSKALLLANDRAITDPTITQQFTTR
jgi:hypothetical protein